MIGLSSLSSREREVAMLYAKGQTSKEIADKLCISPTTVRNHVATIYRKLKISNKTELVNLSSEASKANLESVARSMGGNIAVAEAATSSLDRALVAAQAQQRATHDGLRAISHSPGNWTQYLMSFSATPFSFHIHNLALSGYPLTTVS